MTGKTFNARGLERGVI